MKKVVRTVWISLLSGLAFLVACTSPKGLSRAEKKQLKAERTEIMNKLEQQQEEAQIVQDPKIMMSLKDHEMQLLIRLNEINTQLGDNKAIVENERQIGEVVSVMDSLNTVIESSKGTTPLVYGPPINEPQTSKEQQRKELKERLNQIEATLKNREGACVYGSPEVIQRYGEETRKLRQEAINIRQQLEDLENE